MKTKEERGGSCKIDHSKQVHIPGQKLKAGSIEGKTEIHLSDGRTTIYVHPSKDPEEVLQAYENHIKFGWNPQDDPVMQ